MSLQRELIDLRTETPERQYFYDLGKNAERDLAMAKLAQSYGIYRVKMIEFIYTKRDQISEIADAFVFKKDRS